MAKWGTNELHRRAWAMALKYTIDRFNLPFCDKNRIIDMPDFELGVLQDMMEDFVEPDDRDAFYETIERYEEGFMAGYLACGEE